MARFTYSEGQLLALQHSPLVRRPDNLPRIEQWIESSADQAPRRPKTSSGKSEENEHPNTVRRPSLFDNRPSAKPSSSGEDIFLGPKMSFASASAARQKDKGGSGEDNHTPEEAGSKFDRLAHRKDGYLRDKDGREKEEYRQKGRSGQHNSHIEDDISSDSRPKRGNDYYDKSKEGPISLENANNRRSTGARSKFDQPWFRDGNRPDTKEGEELDGKADYRGWRERDRKFDSWSREQRTEQRTEREPQWMQGPPAQEDVDHTPDDFAKWKESMKASDAKPDEAAYEQVRSPERPVAPTLNIGAAQPLRSADEPLFGVFASKREGNEGTPELPTPKSAAPTKKSSRFAGFFAPTQEEQSQATVRTSPLVEPKSAPAPPITSEDKAGFNRMMQMLRMGGGSSTGPPPPQSARPPSSHLSMDNWLPAAPNDVQERDSTHAERPAKRQLASPDVSDATAHPMGPAHSPRPELASRDSQFLLKLMQQPHSPFTEGQIYGQGFQGRDSPVNSILNSFGTRSQDSRPRGPPPGIPGTDQAFQRSTTADLAAMSNQQPKFSQSIATDDRFGASQQRAPQEYHYRDMASVEQIHRPGRDVGPPPGFNSMRAGPPPGFPAYQGNGLPHQQRPPPPQPNHGIRGMPLQAPPGFFTSPPPQGPPPGFGPQQMNGAQQQQQRRPQVPVGIPPGYEGFSEGQRRGPPMSNQMPYPQYLDQRGGGY